MLNQDRKFFRIVVLATAAVYIVVVPLLFLALTTCSAREVGCSIYNTYEAILIALLSPAAVCLMFAAMIYNYLSMKM